MTPAQIKKTPLVLVIWQDIVTESSGWITFEDVGNLEAVTCYTPGWIVREDVSNIYMVQGWGVHKGEWEPAADCTIPRGCVTDIVPIRKSWNVIRHNSRTGSVGKPSTV